MTFEEMMDKLGKEGSPETDQKDAKKDVQKNEGTGKTEDEVQDKDTGEKHDTQVASSWYSEEFRKRFNVKS